MEWWEKEYAFERTYAQGKAATFLWKYIPKRLEPAISICSTDSDGYWIGLEPGWRAYDLGEDCTMIHEYSIADLKEAIKTIQYIG